MRYHVRARLKDARAEALRVAIRNRTLGHGSVAGGEYLRNMRQARLMPDDSVEWAEVCSCATPLEEERPYWEAFLSCSRFQTHMIGARASTNRAGSPGRVRIAGVRAHWKTPSGGREALFSRA